MPLDEGTESEVLTATNAMNDRPRKCLRYKTPWEAFLELTKAHVTKNTSGALMT